MCTSCQPLSHVCEVGKMGGSMLRSRSPVHCGGLVGCEIGEDSIEL